MDTIKKNTNENHDRSIWKTLLTLVPGTLSNVGIPLVSSVSAWFVLGMVRG